MIHEIGPTDSVLLLLAHVKQANSRAAAGLHWEGCWMEHAVCLADVVSRVLTAPGVDETRQPPHPSRCECGYGHHDGMHACCLIPGHCPWTRGEH